jgi:hypothetical protein
MAANPSTIPEVHPPAASHQIDVPETVAPNEHDDVEVVRTQKKLLAL